MMNLLVTLDSNYVNPLCSMLRSLVQSNSGECINLYVAYSCLTPQDFEKMERAVKGADVEIYPILLDDKLFENAPTKKRISKETYYRMFAPLYLPKSVDRILYIDPDTAVINPLKDFYSMDFGSFLIIGAKHFDGFMGRWNRFRLNLKSSQHYINAGIMLLNIKDMRESFNQQEVFDLIRKKRQILFLADQDAINILYDGKIGYASEYIINLDERCFSRICKYQSVDMALEIVKRNTMIVHFNGKNKPWKENYTGYLDCFYNGDGKEVQWKKSVSI